MALQAGERIVVEPASVGQAPRTGVIEEVVRAEPHERYRIRWDDGHQSVYTPAAGALHRDTREESSTSPRS